MKNAGFIVASLGTAVLLAAGAATLTYALQTPGDVVEEANATELAPAPAASATPSTGERHILPGVTEPRRPATTPTAGGPARNGDDDDDDDDDD